MINQNPTHIVHLFPYYGYDCPSTHCIFLLPLDEHDELDQHEEHENCR